MSRRHSQAKQHETRPTSNCGFRQTREWLTMRSACKCVAPRPMGICAIEQAATSERSKVDVTLSGFARGNEYRLDRGALRHTA